VPHKRKITTKPSPFTWLHFLGHFPESATKFNAL
jgi:hypothetical protein